MDVVTTLIRESETGAVYRSVVTRADREGAERSLALEFTVTAKGAVGFDNRQPGAKACVRRELSRLLAAEMVRVARARVPGALADRTVDGMARELRLHNRTYRAHILRGSSAVADMGSPSLAAPDFDTNAALFERPVRGFPQTLKQLLKKK